MVSTLSKQSCEFNSFIFSLAAITTLYLMEAARHPQYLQPSLDIAHKNHPATKRPTKTKIRTWSSTLPPTTTTNIYNKEDGTLMEVFWSH